MVLKEPTEADFETLQFFKKYLLFKRGSKEGTGKYFIWHYRGESLGHAKYTCPYCNYNGEISQEFELPFKFRCKKCDKKLTINKGKKTKK